MTNNETFSELLQAIESRQKLIWLGMTLGSTVYVPLVFIDVTMTAGRELGQNLGWAFYALAGVLAVASVISRKYFPPGGSKHSGTSQYLHVNCPA